MRHTSGHLYPGVLLSAQFSLISSHKVQLPLLSHEVGVNNELLKEVGTAVEDIK